MAPRGPSSLPLSLGLEELTEQALTPARPWAIGTSLTKAVWEKQGMSVEPLFPPAGQQALPWLTVSLIYE